jgi:hypothetical protein
MENTKKLYSVNLAALQSAVDLAKVLHIFNGKFTLNPIEITDEEYTALHKQGLSVYFMLIPNQDVPTE